tara:strand:- start:155 stop:283 length:129 start_codon:yes stop_codon:yes gene_type:complete
MYQNKKIFMDIFYPHSINQSDFTFLLALERALERAHRAGKDR